MTLGERMGKTAPVLDVSERDFEFAELKAERGKLTDAQAGWLEALAHVQTVGVHVWRPSDFESIAEVLR